MINVGIFALGAAVVMTPNEAMARSTSDHWYVKSGQDPESTVVTASSSSDGSSDQYVGVIWGAYYYSSYSSDINWSSDKFVTGSAIYNYLSGSNFSDVGSVYNGSGYLVSGGAVYDYVTNALSSYSPSVSWSDISGAPDMSGYAQLGAANTFTQHNTFSDAISVGGTASGTGNNYVHIWETSNNGHSGAVSLFNDGGAASTEITAEGIWITNGLPSSGAASTYLTTNNLKLNGSSPADGIDFSGDTGSATHLATTGFSDGRYVNVTGDTMTGTLTVLGNPGATGTPDVIISGDRIRVSDNDNDSDDSTTYVDPGRISVINEDIGSISVDWYGIDISGDSLTFKLNSSQGATGIDFADTAATNQDDAHLATTGLLNTKLSNYYTKTDADDRYALLAGGTSSNNQVFTGWNSFSHGITVNASGTSPVMISNGSIYIGDTYIAGGDQGSYIELGSGHPTRLTDSGFKLNNSSITASGITATPSSGSTELITAGGVYNYLNDAGAGYVKRTGDTMSGPLVVKSNTVAGLLTNVNEGSIEVKEQTGPTGWKSSSLSATGFQLNNSSITATGITATPSSDGTELITSGGVYNYLNDANAGYVKRTGDTMSNTLNINTTYRNLSLGGTTALSASAGSAQAVLDFTTTGGYLRLTKVDGSAGSGMHGEGIYVNGSSEANGIDFSGDTGTNSHLATVGWVKNQNDLTYYYTKTDAEDRYVNVTGDTMTGKLTISSGGLEVTGLTDLNSNLNVDGTSQFNDNVTIGTSSSKKNLTVNGTTDITGNTTVGGTLSVTGATTLSSTLGVTGASTFTGLSTFNGGAKIANGQALNVGDSGTGTATFDINGTNYVTAIDTGNDGAGSTDNRTLATMKSIGTTVTKLTNGNTNYTDILIDNVKYTGVDQGTTQYLADGGTPTDAQKVTLATQATVAATIEDLLGHTNLWNGASNTFTNIAYFNGGINADSGKFTVADTTGNVHTSGTLDVDSTSNFDDKVTITKNGLEVTGLTDLNNNLNVDGTSQFNSAVTIGTTASNANLTVNGAASVTGNTTLGDAATDTLTVNATSTFNSDVTIKSGEHLNVGTANGTSQFNINGTNYVTAIDGGTTAYGKEAGNQRTLATTLTVDKSIDNMTSGDTNFSDIKIDNVVYTGVDQGNTQYLADGGTPTATQQVTLATQATVAATIEDLLGHDNIWNGTNKFQNDTYVNNSKTMYFGTGTTSFTEKAHISAADGNASFAAGNFTIASTGATVNKSTYTGWGNLQIGSNGADNFHVTASDGSLSAAKGNFTVTSTGLTTAKDDLYVKNGTADAFKVVTGTNNAVTIGANKATDTLTVNAITDFNNNVQIDNGSTFTMYSGDGSTQKIQLKGDDGSASLAAGNFTVTSTGATTMQDNLVVNNATLSRKALDVDTQASKNVITIGSAKTVDELIVDAITQFNGDVTIGTLGTNERSLTVNGNFNSKYIKITSSKDGASATGTDAIAIGPLASANVADAIALGHSATSSVANAIAIGLSSGASATDAVAIGNGASASAADAVALNGSASGATSFAANGTANGASSFAFKGTANGANSIAMGTDSSTAADGTYSIALLGSTTATEAVAIGKGATAGAADAIAIGEGASASGADAVALNGSASGATSFAANGTASGANAFAFKGTASSTNAIAIGEGTTASTNSNVTALGASATATGANASALGYSANATGTDSLALGDSDATATNASALGKGASAGAANSTALGNGATVTATATSATALGDSANASNTYATALGYSSAASGSYAISIGDSTASGADSIAEGRSASAGAADTIALGRSANASVANA
ncbi:MAG: hypothetical protein IKR92_04995, partial [Alphaproteobacteria bacterium]|nr:hypothetical protein [Alphaproteobacteria bacterium]